MCVNQSAFTPAEAPSMTSYSGTEFGGVWSSVNQHILRTCSIHGTEQTHVNLPWKGFICAPEIWLCFNLQQPYGMDLEGNATVSLKNSHIF